MRWKGIINLFKFKILLNVINFNKTMKKNKIKALKKL